MTVSEAFDFGRSAYDRYTNTIAPDRDRRMGMRLLLTKFITQNFDSSTSSFRDRSPVTCDLPSVRVPAETVAVFKMKVVARHKADLGA